jgi:hypothetical protein
MDRNPPLPRLLLGIALLLALGAAPAHSVQAAQSARQSSLAPIVPFSGTARLTYTNSDSLVPARAAKDLLRNQLTETFSVRDATHWRIDLQIAAPIIDSHHETIVADGQQVVDYSTLFNRAFRMPGGATESASYLSGLIQARVAPLGTTTAQFIALVKSRPGTKVRSLGKARVAGRTADVLKISPLGYTTTGSCAGSSDCTDKQKGYGSATIWLDHQHGIVLRYEEHGLPKDSGATQGYQYLVTSITFGSGPSDTDLAYVPPVAVEDLPQVSYTETSGSGPNTGFPAPPGFIAIGTPLIHGVHLALQGAGNGGEWPNSGLSYAEGIFGQASQNFVYVKERIRALGLPARLTTGSPKTAGSCQVWTGKFSDGLKWLAMMRGQIAILLVANKLTQSNLVQYAATGICTAPIVPPPSADDLENTALDRLESEIDITRQILGWAAAAAPSAADKTTLRGFDTRLESFDQTVFAIRHRGDPQAVYGPPTFPPPTKESFKNAVNGLKGEVPAAKYQLAQAEAAVQSPADRQTLQQRGTVFDDLIQAVDAMLPA